MKIALVCPYNMFDRPGGVPQVIVHVYEGLKKKGHTVKIITQRPSSYKRDAPENYILFGVTRNFKGGFGTQGNLGMPLGGEEVARVLEQEQFDVINFHEPWVPWLAWQIARNSNAVYVATFHANLLDTVAGKAWTNKIFSPIGRPFLEKMDLFTATSPASSGMLFRMANMKLAFDRHILENLRYLPCGVDLNKFRPVKKRQPLSGPGTKTIVYIGRIEKRKGVEYLITAFAELTKQVPEARLIVAGSGLLSKKLQERVIDEKIPNVSFPGYVTDEERLRLLSNADLACFPAIFGEGFGIVLLEAMAVGTPLLAGNNLGYINVMKGHGRIGLVDPEATKDFVNRLAVFLSDEEQRKLMVSWALNEVKQYDYPKIVDQYEAAYKEAIRLKGLGGHRHLIKDEEKSKKNIRRFFVRRQS